MLLLVAHDRSDGPVLRDAGTSLRQSPDQRSLDDRTVALSAGVSAGTSQLLLETSRDVCSSAETLIVAIGALSLDDTVGERAGSSGRIGGVG
jgi:hypothetical protein